MTIPADVTQSTLLGEYTYEKRPVERGYAGRTLYINLENNIFLEKPVTQQMKDLFTGGRGFALKLLWDAGADAEAGARIAEAVALAKDSSAASEVLRPSLSSLRPPAYPGALVSTTSSEMPLRRFSAGGGALATHEQFTALGRELGHRCMDRQRTCWRDFNHGAGFSAIGGLWPHQPGWRVDHSVDSVLRSILPLGLRGNGPATNLMPGSVAYGLVEHNREAIKDASMVACPGCYPTAALLALVPLVKAGLVDTSCGLIIDAKSGISGAGRTASDRTHFSENHGSMAAYGVMGHRHVAEMDCLLYTSPSPRDRTRSRMPSSA